MKDEDINYVDKFVQTELLSRMTEKFNRLGVSMTENDKIQFFGRFCSNMSHFKFNDEERSLILGFAVHIKNPKFNQLNPTTEDKIVQNLKIGRNWFCDEIKGEKNCSPLHNNEIKAPIGSRNLLNKMLEAAQMNSQRPKQGYRYGNDIMRLAVYNRILAGPMGYKSLQLNLDGCFPSISTTNRFIHRVDHAVIEGELRCDELAAYLRERKLKPMVSISMDATRIQNRIQFSSQVNELVGTFCP